MVALSTDSTSDNVEVTSTTQEFTIEEKRIKIPVLFSEGKRDYISGNFETAAEKLGDATKYAVEVFGEKAAECFDPHFYYGKTLIEIGRSEDDIIKNAMKNMPLPEEEEKNEVPVTESERKIEIESPDSLTEEERAEIKDQVEDALMETATELDKECDECKVDDVETKLEATETKLMEESAPEDCGKVEETPSESTSDCGKVEETPSESTSEDCGKVEETHESTSEEFGKVEETPSESTSEDCDKVEETPESCDKMVLVPSSESATENNDKVKEIASSGSTPEDCAKGEEILSSNSALEECTEEKSLTVNGIEKEDVPAEEIKNMEEDDADMNEAVAEEEGAGDENESESEDPTSIQLAWEVLEAARLICDSQDQNKEWELKKADVLMSLSECSIEDENYKQAVDDLNIALELQLKHECTGRVLAETYFNLARTYRLDDDFKAAAEFYRKAEETLENEICELEKTVSEAESEAKASMESELASLKELIPDIKMKVEDAVASAKQTEQAKEALLTAITGNIPAVPTDEKPATVIEVRKSVKRPAPEEVTECDEAKKAKEDEVVV